MSGIMACNKSIIWKNEQHPKSIQTGNTAGSQIQEKHICIYHGNDSTMNSIFSGGEMTEHVKPRRLKTKHREYQCIQDEHG
mmetsp:Transcript_44709/g.71541  ORF Transcript_44709/g.71541 Transcript_44709/m.71541 type:complete len:81 (+) Transcript_44709:46-288(+)